MLYAYWPAGTVEWDDIAVKQVAAAPAGKGKKDRRPSSETKVRTRGDARVGSRGSRHLKCSTPAA